MRVCPTGFGATIAVVFVLIHWLGEFPLSVVVNRFELRCQLEELLFVTKSVLARWIGMN